jgi:hypothetical protein
MMIYVRQGSGSRFSAPPVSTDEEAHGALGRNPNGNSCRARRASDAFQYLVRAVLGLLLYAAQYGGLDSDRDSRRLVLRSDSPNGMSSNNFAADTNIHGCRHCMRSRSVHSLHSNRKDRSNTRSRRRSNLRPALPPGFRRTALLFFVS